MENDRRALEQKVTDHILGIAPDTHSPLDALAARMLAELTPGFSDTAAQMAAGLGLGKHGWALSSQANLPAYASAADLYAVGDTETADALLVAAWEQTGLTKTIARLRILAIADGPKNRLMCRRSGLIEHAWERHTAGDYISSVPVLLAHVEGLTADFSGGKMFFSRNLERQADVIDEADLTTFQEGLAEARDAFSVGLHDTTLSGTQSRHGILHGRSLGYGTRVMSAQCYALFAAVLDWAQAKDRGEQPKMAPPA